MKRQISKYILVITIISNFAHTNIWAADAGDKGALEIQPWIGWNIPLSEAGNALKQAASPSGITPNLDTGGLSGGLEGFLNLNKYFAFGISLNFLQFGSATNTAGTVEVSRDYVPLWGLARFSYGFGGKQIVRGFLGYGYARAIDSASGGAIKVSNLPDSQTAMGGLGYSYKLTDNFFLNAGVRAAGVYDRGNKIVYWNIIQYVSASYQFCIFCSGDANDDASKDESRSSRSNARNNQQSRNRNSRRQSQTNNRSENRQQKKQPKRQPQNRRRQPQQVPPKVAAKPPLYRDIVSSAGLGNLAMVKEALKHDNVNENRSNDGTALMQASFRGYTAIVKELIKAGANTNMKHKKGGVTALIYASEAGHSDIVTILLRAGANVNIAMNGGNTALHQAASHGKAAAVIALIKGHANVNAKNRVGATPLLQAINNHHQRVALILRRAGGR